MEGRFGVLQAPPVRVQERVRHRRIDISKVALHGMIEALCTTAAGPCQAGDQVGIAVGDHLRFPQLLDLTASYFTDAGMAFLP